MRASARAASRVASPPSIGWGEAANSSGPEPAKARFTAAETSLVLQPEHFSHSAGLVVLYDERNFAYLRLYRSESLESNAVGILIVEDLLAIVLMALLTGIASTGGVEAGQAFAAIGRLGLFMAVSLVVSALGRLLARWPARTMWYTTSAMLVQWSPQRSIFLATNRRCVPMPMVRGSSIM